MTRLEGDELGVCLRAGTAEPQLAVRRPAPYEPLVPLAFVPVASVALAGIIALLASGTVALPFRGILNGGHVDAWLCRMPIDALNEAAGQVVPGSRASCFTWIQFDPAG
jgi:hypothetical protein